MVFASVILIGAVSAWVSGFAVAADLPVTTSGTASSYSVSFPGDDASLSFEVNTDSLDPFTSGGGWIPTPFGGSASFGFVAGIQADGTPRGHLVYIDHDIGLRVQSTSITSFSPDCRTISGDGDSSFGPVHFLATVTDAGEPGFGDTFTIEVAGPVGYFAAGTLAGGDIQAHGSTC
jgi:hypothetical protein